MASTQTQVTTGIRVLLAARGKSGAWLAEQLGVSTYWLSRRMTGRQTFSIDDLDRIAEVFGITLEDLIAESRRLEVAA